MRAARVVTRAVKFIAMAAGAAAVLMVAVLALLIFQVRPETLSDFSRSIVFEAKSRFAFTLLLTINNQRKGVGEKTTCFGCLFV